MGCGGQVKRAGGLDWAALGVSATLALQIGSDKKQERRACQAALPANGKRNLDVPRLQAAARIFCFRILETLLTAFTFS